ncbi:MAG TPA: aminotransferase class I/II-fold pyridoxal phosphate-dependent enzyme [Candidatus Aquilonibacter sp.]|nr:aminotransferase class I/II-fold pyridoxal phosphate-dependent enzyme [Candidatus Aquilonibacter sp.]
MRIDLFRMERTQCLYENVVDFNLSESGVLPLRIEEVLQGAGNASEFLSTGLKYPESDGSLELREHISAWYGAAAENVMVTNGGSEANFTAVWGILEKGDHAAVMLPNYLQTWGLSRAFAASAKAFYLVEKRERGRNPRWALDIEGLHRAVTRKTRLIVLTNPNNPTGAVLSEEEMAEVIRAARRANAWLLVDEIYRGAEVDAHLTPTFWGRYDKLIITSGLSKAFGLPGLRLGWIVAPKKLIAKLCQYHDYTTLTPTIVSDRLARIVMKPERREKVLERTRSIIHTNLPRLEQWIRAHGELFSYIPPVAGAITFFRYKLPISSSALFDRLIKEQSVLITPGSHFGFGRYIRVGYGYDVDYTLRGLARVDITLEELKKSGRKGRGRISKPVPEVAARRGAA